MLFTSSRHLTIDVENRIDMLNFQNLVYSKSKNKQINYFISIKNICYDNYPKIMSIIESFKAPFPVYQFESIEIISGIEFEEKDEV